MSGIVIRYSCSLCGTIDRAVEVPTRNEENVIEWLEGRAMPVIARDHALRSPTCVATAVQNLKIPVDGRDKVGGEIIQ